MLNWSKAALAVACAASLAACSDDNSSGDNAGALNDAPATVVTTPGSNAPTSSNLPTGTGTTSTPPPVTAAPTTGVTSTADPTSDSSAPVSDDPVVDDIVVTDKNPATSSTDKDEVKDEDKPATSNGKDEDKDEGADKPATSTDKDEAKDDGKDEAKDDVKPGSGITDPIDVPAQIDPPVIGQLPPPMVPELDQPFADAVPAPDVDDPYGATLEVDSERVLPGGVPSTPKNLRVELVANDWAEFNWAPANGNPTAYNIYRSDGHVYTIAPDQTDPSASSQLEINKFWDTTSFIDCNYTRFADRLHECSVNGPRAGDTFTYMVSAVNANGESEMSNPITITYNLNSNAPVPNYDDIYKMPDDRFAQNNDLSAVDYWIDDFDLVFQDEFNGDELDENKWNTSLTWGDNSFVNGEQQYLVDVQNDPDFGYDPFTFTGDSLVINAVPIPDNLRANLPSGCDEIDASGLDRCEFLSGVISSHDKFQFIYGYTEARIKASTAPGALSSFYLFHRYTGEGVNYHAPEIDILEYLGENPFGDEDAFQTYHYASANSNYVLSAPTMSYRKPDGGNYGGEFHTFGVLWEPQLVIWYIDGREVKRMRGVQVARQPMNIVNHLVTGSGWAPTPDVSNASLFPIQYEIDYVRVYQRDDFKGSALFGRP